MDVHTIVRHLVACTLFAVVAAGLAAADEAPLSTDLPGAGFSSSTMAQLRFQLEMGVLLSYEQDPSAHLIGWRFPMTLRMGVTDFVELRLDTAGLAYDELRISGAADHYTFGFTDLSLGSKVHFFSPRDPDTWWQPSLGALASLRLPTGSHEYREPGVTFTGLALADWSLPARFGLSLNGGLSVPHDQDGDRFAQGLWTVTVARSWEPLTAEFGSFAELFGAAPAADKSEVILGTGGGVFWTITPNLQLDLFAQAGLTAVTTDLAVVFAVSWRL